MGEIPASVDLLLVTLQLRSYLVARDGKTELSPSYVVLDDTRSGGGGVVVAWLLVVLVCSWTGKIHGPCDVSLPSSNIRCTVCT